MTSISALIDRAHDAHEAAIFARGVTAAEIEAADEADRERLEHLRGAANERRVLAALRAASLPSWIVHVRAGRSTEDQRGADLTVLCEDGARFWLQLKSSGAGARKFAEQAKRRGRVGMIGVLVIPDRINDRQIVDRVLATLLQMRARRAGEASR